MDYKTALEVLENEVVVPAYLSRLEEHGVRFRNSNDARQWLAYGAAIYKQASRRFVLGVPNPGYSPQGFVKKASVYNSPHVRAAIKTVLSQ